MMKKLFVMIMFVVMLIVFVVWVDMIQMWVWFGIGDSFKEMVKVFNVGYKDKVELIEVLQGDFVQKYVMVIVGGQVFDVLLMDLIYMLFFVVFGQFEDLMIWVQLLFYFKLFLFLYVCFGIYKDYIYGLLLLVEILIFVWNKDFYKKVGFDLDKVLKIWEEIIVNVEKICVFGKDIYGFYFFGGGCGGCMIFIFILFVWGVGVDIFFVDGKKVMFDMFEMYKVVEYYCNMVKKDFVLVGVESDNGVNFLLIQSGKIGQQMLGVFVIGMLIIQYLEFNFGVLFILSVDGKILFFVGGDNFVVIKGMKKFDVVKGFFEYVYLLEGQKIMVKYGSLLMCGDFVDQVLVGFDLCLKVGVDVIVVVKMFYMLQFNDLINSVNGFWVVFIYVVIFGDEKKVFVDVQVQMQQIIDDV